MAAEARRNGRRSSRFAAATEASLYDPQNSLDSLDSLVNVNVNVNIYVNVNVNYLSRFFLILTAKKKLLLMLKS